MANWLSFLKQKMWATCRALRCIYRQCWFVGCLLRI